VNTRRPLIWPITLILGGGGALLAGIGGPLGYVFLVSALPLAWRGRLLGLAGLLVGFGGVWLLLMANQFASGGRLSDPAPWLAVGAVPLAIGLVLALAGIGLAVRRGRA
jgi:hypothetical protein